MSDLSHFDDQGQAQMVDVGAKPTSQRRAVAEGWIRMQPETLAKIAEGSHQKGDVLGIARIAGIMASKRTADLIPLCHPIALSHVSLAFQQDADLPGIRCTAQVECSGQTGVEMEALTTVQIALLTIYDMCKAVDRGMAMGEIRLTEKAGGQSGHWIREGEGI